MNILIEQFDLDAAFDDAPAVKSSSVKPAGTDTPKQVDATKSKVDMSVLSKFGDGTPIGKAVRYTINNNTYTFYPNGKVYSSLDKKQFDWNTKGPKVFVNNAELIASTVDRTTKLGIQLATNKKTIEASIINAIYFNKKISRLIKKADTDELEVWSTFVDYLTKPIYATYTDAILRLIYSDATSKLGKYRETNKRAYTYFFSRNYSSITFSSQFLMQYPMNGPKNGLRDIFMIDWLDWDSDEATSYVNNLLSTSFNQIDIENGKIKLVQRLSDDQIHERVMVIYKEQIFGKPSNWLPK
jgi:hypothetical protein